MEISFEQTRPKSIQATKRKRYIFRSYAEFTELQNPWLNSGENQNNQIKEHLKNFHNTCHKNWLRFVNRDDFMDYIKIYFRDHLYITYLIKDIGHSYVGAFSRKKSKHPLCERSRKWQFSLLYVMKTSLRREVGASKKPQNTLTLYVTV